MATVRDILKALDVITGGRVITDSFGYGGANPFVVTKTSGIPGKAVTELPGLVWGDPDMPVKKVAVMMTLTESAIELAGGKSWLAQQASTALSPITNRGRLQYRRRYRQRLL